MKTPSSRTFVHFAASVSLLCLPCVSNAVDYVWDTSASAGIQGGSGDWRNAGGATNWTSDGGTTRVQWANSTSNLAIFSGASGGTVSVLNSISTGGISILTDGYLFSAAVARTVTLGGDLTTSSGVTGTIGSNVTFNRSNNMIVTGAGTMKVGTGGSLSSSGNVLAIRGISSGDTATLVVEGGYALGGDGISLATATAGGNSILTVLSGTVEARGNLIVGGASTLTATVNLTGGVVMANQVQRSSGTGVFNFDGGTLRANVANATFMTGLTAANIKEGGAKIDTNGVAVTIGQALLHSGASSLDGGLNKVGTTLLTLTGASTYTGATTVSEGTLALDNNGTTTARLAGTGSVHISAGSNLMLAQTGVTASTDRINNNADLILEGGTFDLNGLSEGSAGASGLLNLSLLADSSLDFGAASGSNLIQFGGLGTHTTGMKLSIVNWESGSDRFLFAGSDLLAFSSFFSQSEISFNGVEGYHLASFGSYYEVMAVPEPATYLTTAIGGLAILLLRRKSQRVIRSIS